MSNRMLLAGCWRLLRPHIGLLAVAIAATLASAVALGAADPIIQKYLIDSLTTGRMSAFFLAAILLVLSSSSMQVLGYVSTVVSQTLRNRITEGLALEMLGSYYRTPYQEISAHEQGYLVARVFEEPSRLTGDLLQCFLAVVRWGVVLLTAAAVCLWLSWQITLALGLIVPFLIRRAQRSSNAIAELSAREDERQAKLKEGLGRAVDAYRTVSLFGLRGAVHRRVAELLEGYLTTVHQRVKEGAKFQASSSTYMIFAELAVTIGAALQVIRGELSIGGLFAFIGSYYRVVTAVNSLISQVPTVGRIKGELTRLNEFTALAKCFEPTAVHPFIRVWDLDFAYGDKPVLQGVSLEVRPGRRLLLTGGNGSGKSTLAHILVGFLNGQRGEQLRPDPTRVSALLLPFGFIPGTVLDNVGFSDLAPAKQKEFHALARRFGLADNLAQDPATLSQGEQRKLQIMMTLLKDADFYLFDEPLSNIDSASKPLVMDAVVSATAGRALVVIMHGDEQFHGLFDDHFDVHALSRVTRARTDGLVIDDGDGAPLLVSNPRS